MSIIQLIDISITKSYPIKRHVSIIKRLDWLWKGLKNIFSKKFTFINNIKKRKTYNFEEFFIESIGAKGQRPPVTTYRKQRVIEHRIHYRTLHNTRWYSTALESWRRPFRGADSPMKTRGVWSIDGWMDGWKRDFRERSGPVAKRARTHGPRVKVRF